jgi:hypothetical protein
MSLVPNFEHAARRCVLHFLGNPISNVSAERQAIKDAWGVCVLLKREQLDFPDWQLHQAQAL